MHSVYLEPEQARVARERRERRLRERGVGVGDVLADRRDELRERSELLLAALRRREQQPHAVAVKVAARRAVVVQQVRLDDLLGVLRARKRGRVADVDDRAEARRLRGRTAVGAPLAPLATLAVGWLEPRPAAVDARRDGRELVGEERLGQLRSSVKGANPYASCHY